MLLVLEKIYATINIPVDEYRNGDFIYWPKKVEIKVTDIYEWMHSTGRDYPHGWRLRDYIRWAYGEIEEYDPPQVEYLFVDYVYQVKNPAKDGAQYVLYRHTGEGDASCAVKLTTGTVYAAKVIPINTYHHAAEQVELMFSELITDKQSWFENIAIRGAQGRWGKKVVDDHPCDLFFRNIADEIPDFHFAYSFEQDYDKMVLAMAYEAAFRMSEDERFHDMSNDDAFSHVFYDIYHTGGPDADDWEKYAEENGLDVDDESAKESYEETCNEFAYAYYKIDSDCEAPVRDKTGEILRECFYSRYEF